MKKNLRQLVCCVIILALLAVFSHNCLNALAYGRRILSLGEDVTLSENFRAMALSKENYEYLMAAAEGDRDVFCQYLAALLLEENFTLTGKEAYRYSERRIKKSVKKLESLKKSAYIQLVEACQAVFMDLVYFPAPDLAEDQGGTSFENGWMDPRSYGGKRSHEGTDIMAEINERGLYPVISASDGVVEKIGWLPQGGYRIGIRAPHGGYFYYAHLYSYAKEFKVGEEISAGTLLGLMGDSGYGEEGTVGKFPVHLHFGIYLNTKDGKESSINPYYVLEILKEVSIE